MKSEKCILNPGRLNTLWSCGVRIEFKERDFCRSRLEQRAIEGDSPVIQKEVLRYLNPRVG